MLPAKCFTSIPPEPEMSDKCLHAKEIRTESSHVHIKTGSSDIMDQVCGCTDQDKSVICTLKELGSGTDLWGDKWEEHNGLVLFRGKVDVPLDTQLQHGIVRPTTHPGDQTLRMLEDN